MVQRENPMKHFIIELTYLMSAEQLAEIVTEHRAYLQIGYDAGKLLFSGPQNPRVGGIVVARGESLEEIQQFFSNDPYQKKGAASYRFIEFSPVKFQPFIEPWLQE
jgi:uncharacterized protein YciI